MQHFTDYPMSNIFITFSYAPSAVLIKCWEAGLSFDHVAHSTLITISAQPAGKYLTPASGLHSSTTWKDIH